MTAVMVRCSLRASVRIRLAVFGLIFMLSDELFMPQVYTPSTTILHHPDPQKCRYLRVFQVRQRLTRLGGGVSS